MWKVKNEVVYSGSQVSCWWVEVLLNAPGKPEAPEKINTSTQDNPDIVEAKAHAWEFRKVQKLFDISSHLIKQGKLDCDQNNSILISIDVLSEGEKYLLEVIEETK